MNIFTNCSTCIPIISHLCQTCVRHRVSNLRFTGYAASLAFARFAPRTTIIFVSPLPRQFLLPNRSLYTAFSYPLRKQLIRIARSMTDPKYAYCYKDVEKDMWIVSLQFTFPAPYATAAASTSTGGAVSKAAKRRITQANQRYAFVQIGRKPEPLASSLARMEQKIMKLNAQWLVWNKLPEKNAGNQFEVFLLDPSGSKIDSSQPTEASFRSAKQLVVSGQWDAGLKLYQSWLVNCDPITFDKFRSKLWNFEGMPILHRFECSLKPSKILISYYEIPTGDDSNKSDGNIPYLANIDDLRFLGSIDYLKSSFVPDSSLVSRDLVALVTPYDVAGRPGMPSSTGVMRTVGRRPEFISDQRVKEAKDTVVPEKGLRVVSYNVLADIYVKPGPDGFFPYCHKDAIAREYRLPLLMNEINGYKADVVCLQECDTSFHQTWFNQHLSGKCGYVTEHGFAKKAGDVAEGLATYFRPEKLEFVMTEIFGLTQSLELPSNQDLKAVLCLDGKMESLLSYLNTVFQLTLLKSKILADRYILVANTHLYWDPRVPRVKVVQFAACLRHIESYIAKAKEENSIPARSTVSVVFCGDLNSVPDSAVFDLAVNGTISNAHSDWAIDENDGPVGGSIPGLDIHHSFQFASACGTPQFTNYTQGFKGCLDYVFVDPTLKVLKVFEFPSEEKLSKYTAIPSWECPSDHIPLICDLELVGEMCS